MADLKVGKGNNVDFSKFNGVTRKEATKNNKQLQSIFDHYDKNKDGILDATEFSTMQTEMTDAASGGSKASLGKKEAKKYLHDKVGIEGTRDDIKTFMDNILGDDSVTNATQDKNGRVTVKYKNGNSEVYDTDKDKNGNGIKIPVSETKVNGNQTTTTLHQGDLTTTTETVGGKKTKETAVDSSTNTTTVTTYDSDGTTIKSRVRTKGATTEELDPTHNDRVTKRTTDKGSNTYEIDEFAYDDSVNPPTETVTHTDISGNKTRRTTGSSVIEVLDTNGNVAKKQIDLGDGNPPIDQPTNPHDKSRALHGNKYEWKGQNANLDAKTQTKLGNMGTASEVLTELLNQPQYQGKTFDTAKLLQDLITQNPSMFDTNGAIYSDADFSKLDFPQDLSKYIQTGT